MNSALKEIISKVIRVNPPELEEIGKFFSRQSLSKGEFLLKEGNFCSHLYFIEKGCLRLFYIDSKGREFTRFMAFENTFLSSMTAFISREPSTEYIQAMENSILYSIGYDDFLELRSSFPSGNYFYIYILEYGVTVITARLNNILTKSASERYRQLLFNNPEIIQRLSNNDLATYLNISPETLSRLKSNLSS